MVKSTLQRQQQLRRRRKKLGQERREFFLTDLEYKHLKEYLREFRRNFEPVSDNQTGDEK